MRYLPLFLLLILSSCVSTKKYNELQALADRYLSEKQDCENKLDKSDSDNENLEGQLSQLKNEYKIAQDDLAKLKIQKEQLQKDTAYYKQLNKTLSADKSAILNEASSNQSKMSAQLAAKEKELNAISAQQKALDEALKLREQQIAAMEKENAEKAKKIEDLENQLKAKDEALQNLKTNISNALKNFNSDEIQVVEKNGKLYVSLSEKLLFKSGSFEVDKKGEEAILQLGTVLKDENDFDIVVEGHTDNVPYNGSGVLKDNWDLSVKRATSVVRLLTEKGGVPGEKIAASGRSSYIPVTPNDTAESKAKNRRTEIILSPKIDKIMNLLND